MNLSDKEIFLINKALTLYTKEHNVTIPKGFKIFKKLSKNKIANLSTEELAEYITLLISKNYQNSYFKLCFNQIIIQSKFNDAFKYIIKNDMLSRDEVIFLHNHSWGVNLDFEVSKYCIFLILSLSNIHHYDGCVVDFITKRFKIIKDDFSFFEKIAERKLFYSCKTFIDKSDTKNRIYLLPIVDKYKNEWLSSYIAKLIQDKCK